MKKIILPTDFSENAYNAIRFAAKLFKTEDTIIYLLHTYTPPVYASEFVSQSPIEYEMAEAYRENSLSQLKKLKAKVEEEFSNPKHTFVIHSAFNTVIGEVLQTIKNEKADLVIMGTQGATGAKEILLGTNTVHLIKKVTCPIIAIPSGFVCEMPKEIMFPTDYGIAYKKTHLRQLLDIAKLADSNIDVVYVSSGYDLTETQEKNKITLDGILAETAHHFHNLPDQSVIDAINGFQTKKQIGLLAMIQNKHTFFERLFIEPIIKKIGFHVNVPFMVMPQI